jgi:hypothetical protein
VNLTETRLCKMHMLDDVQFVTRTFHEENIANEIY